MQDRNSNIELLRLLLMLLIVIHHGIVHGLGMTGLFNPKVEFAIRPDDMLLLSIVNCLCIPAVNVFILISGYFGIKPTLNKIVKLVLAMVLYTLAFTVCYYLYIGDWKHTLSGIFIFSHSSYWFLVDYLFFMCFVPLLNNMFDTQSPRYTTVFIISLFVISSYFGFVWGNNANVNGYTLLQFIMMYCIGRYIKIHNIKLKKPCAFSVYMLCSAICGVGMFVLYSLGLNDLAWRLTYYNNPLIIASAIAMFLFFKDIKFSSKTINRLALSSLAIYLFQSSKLVEAVFYKIVKQCYLKLESLLCDSMLPAICGIGCGGGYFVDYHSVVCCSDCCEYSCRQDADED